MTNLGNNSLTIAKYLFSEREYKDKNIVFSPLSLQVVLSIIAAGSEGPTQQQLLDFLRFESTDQLNSFISYIHSVILKEANPIPRPHDPFINAAAPTNPFYRPCNPFFNAATPSGLSYNNEDAASSTPFHLPRNPFFNAAAPTNPFHRPRNPFFNASPATPFGLSYNNEHAAPANPFHRPCNPFFNVAPATHAGFSYNNEHAAPATPFHRPSNPFFNAAPATPAGFSYNNEQAAPATPFRLPHNPFINAASPNPFHRPFNHFFNAAPATSAGLSYNNAPLRLPHSPFYNAFPATPTGLSFINGVWVEQTLPVQPSFKEIVSSQYKATLSSVDFKSNAIEVIKEVNLWAEKETNGLIKEIIPQGSLLGPTSLIFANALHFKGAWKVPFINNGRRNIYDFYLLNKRSVKVPFMTSNRDQFIGVFDGFKVLRLPYEQGQDQRQLSMYIFLPNAKDGLRGLVEKVSSEFELLEQNLPLISRSVGDFRIPKFKFSFGLETSHALKELGVILPFCPGGLTKMVDSFESRDLFVSKIFQKCFIEVNEEGTEAVAASVSMISTRGGIDMCIPRGIDFVADHPFLFLIKEDSTQTILFVGQVLNPLAS